MSVIRAMLAGGARQGFWALSGKETAALLNAIHSPEL